VENMMKKEAYLLTYTMGSGWSILALASISLL
jgi:hypothetical protein